MQVDIYIREKSGKREIRVPLLPEELPFPSGDTVGISYEVMELGEVVIPSGTELDTYSWESELPGELRQNDPMLRGTWQPPKIYDSILRDWQKSGTELNLLVTGYPINADVYLKSYQSKASGPFGDIFYKIEFIEARTIVVTTTKVEQPTAPTTRPATTSTTYVIKSGDTLWGIARKFYGSGTKWKTIYDANKDIIEKTAKKYGRKSSDNGHWIYPGVTLTIPNVSGSAQTTSSPSPTTAAKNASYTANRNSFVENTTSRINALKKQQITRVEMK